MDYIPDYREWMSIKITLNSGEKLPHFYCQRSLYERWKSLDKTSTFRDFPPEIEEEIIPGNHGVIYGRNYDYFHNHYHEYMPTAKVKINDELMATVVECIFSSETNIE
jgi:hypothetical protein